MTTLLASGTQYTGTDVVITTSLANLIVIALSCHGTPALTASDTDAQVWTGLTEHGAILSEGPRHSVRLLYKFAPTVGASKHFSQTGGTAGSIAALAFDGVVTSPFDVEAHNNSVFTATTCAAGSVTPTTGNSLIVAAWAIDDPSGSSFSVNSGFTIATQKDVATGTNHGLVTAYKIVSGTAAVNPTLTRNANTQSGDAAVIAVFKISGGGGASPLRSNSLLNGLGASGPFFSNPLGYTRTPQISLAAYQRERAQAHREFMARVQRAA